jgi:hypothetical protein
MKLRTLGHASLAIYRDGASPVLFTDPWLVGSAYWRSWWLQHYPSAEELNWAANSAFIYVTHEHPDHFHLPTIRRLGHSPSYLFPSLPERGYLDHMTRLGYRAELVAPMQWRGLGEEVSILSIPVFNDDSLLLIDTPNAIIFNFNDAKPLPPVLKTIRRLADRIDKPRVLLCSYSPASLVNSFLDDGGVVSLKSSRDYVDYISGLSDALDARCYIPFASQATFDRPDSRWANDYQTTYEDLRRHWRSRARLLPPYTTLDLTDLTHEWLSADRYRPMDPAKAVALVEQRLAAEKQATMAAEDVTALERRLNTWRWLLCLIFRHGISFLVGERRFGYRALRGRLVEDRGPATSDCLISVPTLTMKEALRNGRVSDLGITMFVRVRLLRRIDPRRIYALFMLLQFADYGHSRDVGSFFRWLRAGIRCTLALRLPTREHHPGPSPIGRGAGRRLNDRPRQSGGIT